MLGTLDDVPFHQASGQMHVAMRAQSIGRIELIALGAIKSVGLLAMVKTENVGDTELVRSTGSNPAFGIGLGLRGADARLTPYFPLRSWRLT